MRLQLALNVANIDEAVDYYGKLFNTTPHKRRPGYANFEVEQPPLKLVLFENAYADERLNHLGVEVQHADEVADAEQRFRSAGILDITEADTTCCHAVQDKVWSQEPQGLRWEWYRITSDSPTTAQSATDPAVMRTKGACCA